MDDNAKVSGHVRFPSKNIAPVQNRKSIAAKPAASDGDHMSPAPDQFVRAFT